MKSATSTDEKPDWSTAIADAANFADAPLPRIIEKFLNENQTVDSDENQTFNNYKMHGAELQNCFDILKGYLERQATVHSVKLYVDLVNVIKNKIKECLLNTLTGSEVITLDERKALANLKYVDFQQAKIKNLNKLSAKDLNNLLNELEWIVKVTDAAIATFISGKIQDANLINLFNRHYKFEQFLRNKCQKDDATSSKLNKILLLLRQFCVGDNEFENIVRDVVEKRQNNKKEKALLTVEESEKLFQAINDAITHYVVDESVSSPSVVFGAYYKNDDKTQNNARDGKARLIEFMGEEKIEKENKENKNQYIASGVNLFFNIIQSIKQSPKKYITAQEQNYLSSCLILCNLIININTNYRVNISKIEKGDDTGKIIMAWVWWQMEDEWRKFSIDSLFVLQKLAAVLVAAKNELHAYNESFENHINRALNEFPKFRTVHPGVSLCAELLDVILEGGKLFCNVLLLLVEILLLLLLHILLQELLGPLKLQDLLIHQYDDS